MLSNGRGFEQFFAVQNRLHFVARLDGVEKIANALDEKQTPPIPFLAAVLQPIDLIEKLIEIVLLSLWSGHSPFGWCRGAVERNRQTKSQRVDSGDRPQRCLSRFV
jgi:hypothetical protein